jgi:hypothetical protein
MTTHAYPALLQFFGGYLHQDWADEFSSPEQAIAAFINQEPVEARRAAQQELADLIPRVPSLEDPVRVLMDLGSYYDPTADGHTVAGWLEHVRATLEAI